MDCCNWVLALSSPLNWSFSLFRSPVKSSSGLIGWYARPSLRPHLHFVGFWHWWIGGILGSWNIYFSFMWNQFHTQILTLGHMYMLYCSYYCYIVELIPFIHSGVPVEKKLHTDVWMGIGLTRAHANSPLSKLTPTSLPEIWQKSPFLWRKTGLL